MINNILKNLEEKMTKLEQGYFSVLNFLVKLIFWVAALFVLVPILRYLFALIFHEDISFSDFVLLITAAFIIAYTYEAQKTREQMKENDLRPVILRAGFIEKWGDVQFHFEGNKLTNGKPIEFEVLRGIATSIEGYIILDGFKYPLLFAGDITNLGERGFYFSKKWGWMGANAHFFAIFNDNYKERVDDDNNNEIYLAYSDIEGNKYYTCEDDSFSQKSERVWLSLSSV